jgi:peptidoglycan/xylan/chitin deacetylase (PgdA/CDA1 family)
MAGGAVIPPFRMGEGKMIRALPKGPFDGYLRTHYFSGKPGAASRCVMGCGAIFMIQRVRPATECLTAATVEEETDTLLLREMLALVAVQKLDILPLDQVPQRLAEDDFRKRFVCFTFDGAYRGILETVQPLFAEYDAPYTVYAGTDFLDGAQVPWWMALEALVRGVERIMPATSGLPGQIASRTLAEKRAAHLLIGERLAAIPTAERTAIIQAECERHSIDLAETAAREMLTPAELKALADDPRVTIGSMAGGRVPLHELSYDAARENIVQSLDTLEAALGARPRHLAFPGGHTSDASARDVKIAADVGLDTAVTGLEGALWPEHTENRFALPRIALSNDPAALMRVLMLGEAMHSGEITAVGRKIA